MSRLQALSELTASIALVATDMDGTLTQRGKFSPAMLQALFDLQAANLPVVIVTGRSAGWVSGLASYLPIAGAMAENGGVYFQGDSPQMISPIGSLIEHRQQLAQTFDWLKSEFPMLQESADNAFRLTDWTFDVQGLSLADLNTLADRCFQQGWSFTYSTVQCHIRPLPQDKAPGLQWVLNRYFPQVKADRVLTVGDSPNDESLFDPQQFPLSIGVANVQHYRDRLAHLPTYITASEEAAGFCELVAHLLQQIIH